MNTPRDLMHTEYTRVWLIENRAGPANVPSYEGLWKAGNLAWPQGDVTLERIPNPDEYGKFLTVNKIPGDQGNPSLTITAQYLFQKSDLLRILRKGCDVDIQVHMGKCKDPQDFNGGWEKIVILEAARLTNYSLANLGALEPSERAKVNEEVPFSGEDLYEVLPITFQEKAASEVVRKIIDMTVCDKISCGACGDPSDGCEKIFALSVSIAGSPGLLAEVVYSSDGGNTWNFITVSTLAATEDPSAFACVGTKLVVTQLSGAALHYATISEILAGTATWTKVTTGFVAGKGPNAIVSTDPRHTWLVGDDGYVYFTEDPTAGVSVQEAGVITGEDLMAVHAYDQLNVVAVGDANAMLVTRNGGDTWAAVTGPEAGAGLTCIFMKGANEWFVGTSTGKLWYTIDGGVTWTLKSFPGSAAGTVKDITFVTPSVGYMAHNTAANAGRILRTIDGGHSWYVAPEGNTSIPSNLGISALAVCEENANVVYGGGDAATGSTDGIIIKGS